MASKKGIGVTIGILVGVVVASFLFYLIPEGTEMKLVVSDFEKNLDDIDERATMLSTGINESFEDLMNYRLSPEEYFVIASVTQSQVNSLIIELTLSNAPQEWSISYKTYNAALKKLNDQITETIVVANLIKDGENSSSVNEIISKISELRMQSLDLIEKSNNSRP
jgi:MFS superfamily sulfate permease-like transporter